MSAERLFYDEKTEKFSLCTPEMIEIARSVPCGRPDTYGATPLNHQLVSQQQLELLKGFADLVETDIPPSTPQHIANYMKLIVPSRFVNRGVANHENYATAPVRPEAYANNDSMLEIMTRAETGHASPAELLITRQALGIRSVELACVTHPYGKHLDIRDEMKRSVKESIESMGGEYYRHPESKFFVKGFVDLRHPMVDDDLTPASKKTISPEEHIAAHLAKVIDEPLEIAEPDYSQGLLITRQSTIGEMVDGTTVRERTSFILRTDDDSIVPPESLEAICQLDRHSPTWKQDAVTAGRLDEFAKRLWEVKEYSLLIPISTTVYAFNMDSTKYIQAKQANDEYQQRLGEAKAIRDNFPNLFSRLVEDPNHWLSTLDDELSER